MWAAAGRRVHLCPAHPTAQPVSPGRGATAGSCYAGRNGSTLRETCARALSTPASASGPAARPGRAELPSAEAAQRPAHEAERASACQHTAPMVERPAHSSTIMASKGLHRAASVWACTRISSTDHRVPTFAGTGRMGEIMAAIVRRSRVERLCPLEVGVPSGRGRATGRGLARPASLPQPGRPERHRVPHGG